MDMSPKRVSRIGYVTYIVVNGRFLKIQKLAAKLNLTRQSCTRSNNLTIE